MSCFQPRDGCSLLLLYDYESFCYCRPTENLSNDDNTKYRRDLGSVLAMQRFKAFLQGTNGERVLMFWLDVEKFRRQTPKDCRRFIYREIRQKYIHQGAWLELPETLKWKINSKISAVGIFKANNKGNADFTSMDSTALLSCQQSALELLQRYWVPKYLAHRDKRRQELKKKLCSTWTNKGTPVKCLTPASGTNTTTKSAISSVLQALKQKAREGAESRATLEEIRE